MYGCFHANIAGTMSTDVHVIGKFMTQKKDFISISSH